MRWPYNRGWHPSPWWENKLQNGIKRLLRRMDSTPEASLNGAQAALRFNLRKGGPDSVATVNSMVGVAEQLQRQERYAEEVLLREQIVEALRRNVGLEHGDTLTAEANMGRCLVDLDRPEEAESFLAHVAAGTEGSPGIISSDSLNALLLLAVLYRSTGRLEDVRHLLIRALNEYAFRGMAEGAPAMDVSSLLAGILFLLDERTEAVLLCRHILDVRERTLGPDESETLASLERLVIFLMRTDHLVEASHWPLVCLKSGDEFLERIIRTRPRHECSLSRSSEPDGINPD